MHFERVQRWRDAWVIMDPVCDYGIHILIHCGMLTLYQPHIFGSQLKAETKICHNMN